MLYRVGRMTESGREMRSRRGLMLRRVCMSEESGEHGAEMEFDGFGAGWGGGGSCVEGVL